MSPLYAYVHICCVCVCVCVSSYCVDGQRRLCPVGRFGNTTGLQSQQCTDVCLDGCECQLGSDQVGCSYLLAREECGWMIDW